MKYAIVTRALRVLAAAATSACVGASALPSAALASTGAAIPARAHCVRTPALPRPLPIEGAQRVTRPTSACMAGRLPEPVGRVAFKGRPPAPSPPGGNLHCDANACYWYASAQQTLGSGPPPMVGLHGSLSQLQPYLGVNDFHSLAEISVESADLQQIVEVGWTVDRGVNGDVLPHLFAFHWVNGAPTCYNACGFVPVLSPWGPGSLLPVTLSPQDYAIVHVSGSGWWVLAMGSWIGYFPDALWPAAANFSAYAVANWFGEVSVPVGAQPCSYMGDGIYGGLPWAALGTNLGFYDTALNDVSANPITFQTNSSYYSASQPLFNSFTFGGPGAGCP